MITAMFAMSCPTSNCSAMANTPQPSRAKVIRVTAVDTEKIRFCQLSRTKMQVPVEACELHFIHCAQQVGNGDDGGDLPKLRIRVDATERRRSRR